MSLSKEDIEELKEIYRKEFGKEISDGEAYDLGIRLITLFKLTCRPILKDGQKEQVNSKGSDKMRQVP